MASCPRGRGGLPLLFVSFRTSHHTGAESQWAPGVSVVPAGLCHHRLLLLSPAGRRPAPGGTCCCCALQMRVLSVLQGSEAVCVLECHLLARRCETVLVGSAPVRGVLTEGGSRCARSSTRVVVHRNAGSRGAALCTSETSLEAGHGGAACVSGVDWRRLI